MCDYGYNIYLFCVTGECGQGGRGNLNNKNREGDDGKVKGIYRVSSIGECMYHLRGVGIGPASAPTRWLHVWKTECRPRSFFWCEGEPSPLKESTVATRAINGTDTPWPTGRFGAVGREGTCHTLHHSRRWPFATCLIDSSGQVWEVITPPHTGTMLACTHC